MLCLVKRKTEIAFIKPPCVGWRQNFIDIYFVIENGYS